MNATSQASANATSNEQICTTSPSDASRYIAWVSAAGAIVWGVTLGGFVGYDLDFGGDAALQFMLYATILHIGQAFSSAISFKIGALFAVFAVAVMIGNIQHFGLLTTTLICSACALVIARRHALSPHPQDGGEP